MHTLANSFCSLLLLMAAIFALLRFEAAAPIESPSRSRCHKLRQGVLET